MAYRTDIDGLRAIAVGVVVLFHAGIGCPGGFIGVDVFFVISGYLITGLLLDRLDQKTFSFSEFWRRRICRIVPAATCATLATVAVGCLVLTPPELKDLATSAIAQQVMLANIYFEQRVGYFGGEAEYKPLLHMWSLAVEEQFYLFMPLVLVAVYRWSRNAVVVALLTICIASFGLSVWTLTENPAWSFYQLPSRAWELCLGGAIQFLPRIPDRRNAVAIASSIGGLFCIALATTTYDRSTPFPGIAALLPCVGTALLLVGGGRGHLVDRMLSLSAVRMVGQMSYSLYLVHWPLMAMLRIHEGPVLSPLMAVGAIAASVLLAYLSWWAIEQPGRRLASRLTTRRVLIGLVASVTVTTLGCTVIWRTDGLPFRFGPEARKVFKTPPVPQEYRVALEDLRLGEVPMVGEAEELSVVIWGDSHTTASVPGIERICSDLGIRSAILSRFGTPPLLDAGTRAGGNACIDWNAAAMDFVESSGAKVVVLIARWSYYVESTGSEDGGALLSETAFEGATPRSPARIFCDQLAITVDRLHAGGLAVVLVAQFPDQTIDPLRLLAWEHETGLRSSKATRRSDYDARQGRVRGCLESVAERSGAILVDPFEVMFDVSGGAAGTRLGDADGAFYADRSHISGHGAVRLLAPSLAESIAEKLGKVPE